MKRLLTLTGLLFLLSSPRAMSSPDVFVVTYRSLELTYLDGGREDGLAIGDRGEVRRGGTSLAELEVAYIAANSASCRVLNSTEDIAIGDSMYVTFRVVRKRPRAAVDSAGGTSTSTRRRSPLSTAGGGSSPRLSGSVGFRVSHWEDGGPANLDFTQSNVSVNARLEHLWGDRLTFSVRTRSRYNRRQRSYSVSAPRSDWDNNVYEFAMVYGGDASPFHLHLGRISPRRVGGIGRFDGVLIEERIASIRLAAFAGIEPTWQYRSRGGALRKYGGYINYDSGKRPVTVDLTLATVAEYHASMVSREFVHTRGRIAAGSRFNFSHTAEFDINRDWRRASAGESISLSSVYLNARYQLTPALAVSVNFDNRKNHWSYVNRELADSLFDDNLRQGLRGRLDIRLPLRIMAQLGAGSRDRGRDVKPTRSYNGSVRQSGVLIRGLSLRAGVSRFWGEREKGGNTTINVDQSLPRRIAVGIGYSTYNYTLTDGSVSRDNRRIDLTVRFPVARRLRFNGQYQRSTGDDTNGHRIDTGLRLQF